MFREPASLTLREISDLLINGFLEADEDFLKGLFFCSLLEVLDGD